MSRFDTEFSRLYLVPDQASPTRGRLVAADGSVRALVLELARPAEWAALSVVWQAVQSEWELPAAAIAVSGMDGLQLWFSVSEPVSAVEATRFLAALQSRYLGALPARRMGLYPRTASTAPGGVVHVREVPAAQEGTGHWSAFVSPDLASVFGDEPWLDIPPQYDQQADILSRLRSMPVARFRELLGHWEAVHLPDVQPAISPSGTSAGVTATPFPASGAANMGPREFLLQVMNDPQVDLKDRIDAAKALLPYMG